MLASEPKAEVINGTYKVLSYLFTRSSMVLGRWGDRDTSHLVVCQNGILDVHSNILEPHNPSYFTTSILPYSYNPSATAPQWETFLNDVLENDNDRIMLLQEWLGYMLITSYEHQKAMLLIGASRSGKGTIGHIMQALVGSEAYAGLTLEGLAVDAILENVLDKTVLFFGDVHSVSGPDRNRILDRFKSITGNDPLPINRKYKGAWNGRFPGRITLAANNIPAFADDSGAMANRLLILPFNRSYLDYEDTKLKDKLLTELPGICNWALIGLARLRLTGKFTDSAAGRSEREEIMLQQAPLMGFVTECCELGLGRESTEAIYNRYKMWKSSEGGTAMPRTTFSRAMRSMLRGKIDKCTVRPDNTTKTVQGFSGIQLKPLDPVYAPNNVIPFTGTK
jgi:putative DNA primase/helicase